MKTGLKIVSVLMLILGVFTLATGVLDIVMLSNTGSDGVAVKALMGLAFILFVLSGLLDVIGGLLGLRAANDSGKATGAIVFGPCWLCWPDWARWPWRSTPRTSAPVCSRRSTSSAPSR